MTAIRRAVAVALPLVLFACAKDPGTVVPDAAVSSGQPPGYAPCAFEDDESASPGEIEVNIVLLCVNPADENYGVVVSRFAADDGSSLVELSLRALWRDAPWYEDLEGVAVEDGVAVAEFSPESRASSVWANISTGEAGQRFLMDFLETARQFPDVRAVALRFGGDYWWPLETDESPLGYDIPPLPLDP